MGEERDRLNGRHEPALLGFVMAGGELMNDVGGLVPLMEREPACGQPTRGEFPDEAIGSEIRPATEIQHLHETLHEAASIGANPESGRTTAPTAHTGGHSEPPPTGVRL
jgi:hypothetical protein